MKLARDSEDSSVKTGTFLEDKSLDALFYSLVIIVITTDSAAINGLYVKTKDDSFVF